MATRIPTASRNAGCNAIGNLADGGPAAGTVQIRTGTQPASADSAATGTLLATVTLNDPAWGAASAGVKTLQGVPLAATGAADGQAGWFRVLDSTSATVVDGAATVTGGGGELQLNTTTISTGVDFEITAGTLTMPAG
jgi:hypothetical protein